MAREGLRTLVIGKRVIAPEVYSVFKAELAEAALSALDRDARMQACCEKYLEQDLDLLGVTGVEDKLQEDVKDTLECLRNAGIRTWMLTGDKVETARCIAASTRIIPRNVNVIICENRILSAYQTLVSSSLRKKNKWRIMVLRRHFWIDCERMPTRRS